MTSAGLPVFWRWALLGVLILMPIAFLAGCGGASPPPPPPVTISISPSSLTILVGGSQQFTAQVTGSSNTGASWSVNDTVGGNSTFGTIDVTGRYMAPAVPPSPNVVTVKATSTAVIGRTATASVTIVNPVPQVTSVSPSNLDAGGGDTTLTVTGSGFAQQSAAQLAGTALATTFVSSTQLTAVLSAALLNQAGTFPVTVVTPAPGGGPSGSVDLQILIVVQISPTTATVLAGDTQPFTATILGDPSASVTWRIDGMGTGNSNVGTISADGLFTAPAAVPVLAERTVRVSSLVDSAKSATASVAIASPGEDWPKYRRDLANTGKSGEVGISSANVARLRRKWTFDTGGPVSASPAVATVGGIRTVYVGAWNGTFHAINADSGAARWSFAIDPVIGCTFSGSDRIASSPAVENGVVYFGAANAFVYALDAATGALVWKKQLGDPCQGYEIWSSPAVFNGVVYVGVASHESAPCVVGQVVALNAATGASAWGFDTIDQSTCPSDTCLGAGVWSSPAIDVEFGTLFIGTGNAGRGCSPSTDNAAKYPDGILALDLPTGQLKSFSPTYPYDLNDLGDIGASPLLHESRTVNECTDFGVAAQWITVPSKDSFVYTAPRGASGLLADPLGIALAAGEAIASPGLASFAQSQACGTGSFQSYDQGNDILVPTADGNLFDVRQTSDGSTAIHWNTLVRECPPDNPCPLFSAPALIADLAFFGGGEGNFYAANRDGEIVFAYGTNGLVASGPAISHGGVYFGSYDGMVYCLSLDGL